MLQMCKMYHILWNGYISALTVKGYVEFHFLTFLIYHMYFKFYLILTTSSCLRGTSITDFLVPVLMSNVLIYFAFTSWMKKRMDV